LFWGFMGSEELLELLAWGDSEVGRLLPVGVLEPGWCCAVCDELLRFEPTRFLKRAFMEFISQRGSRELGEREGVGQVESESES
jgi:hypothetical protein